MNKKETKRGFTLIELLVVIAILATLAVAVTLILNPAELVRQGRDSTRLSDLSALQSAISLYLADQAEASFENNTVCTAGSAGAAHCPAGSSISTSTAVDGSGWVTDGSSEPNFNNISSGAPLSNLPLDPVNDSSHFYVWGSNTSEEYELNAAMESTKFSNGGGEDVESNSEDGGDDDQVYEIGNDPALDVL